MTGSISEVSSASTLRRLIRKLRLIMVDGCWRRSSVIGHRLVVNTVAGQREEHVIERRAVQVERADELAAGVDLVEDGPDMGRRPVGRDVDGAPLGIGVLRKYPQKSDDRGERGAVG